MRAVGACLLLGLAARVAAAQQAAAATPEPAPSSPIRVSRATSPITVDGNLSDPAWKDAAVLDVFYETTPGDNVAPKAHTVAYLTYDDRFFYIGLRCDDPEPAKIRAPYVERDQVLGTDDNVAIFLDTRNDRRSAQEFRVNPRGIQGDAMFNDANGNEDFSPDYFYDSAAQVGPEGWTAELRIPFSSLRYRKADPQTWGILVWRNYPRDFRYAMFNTPLPRGSNCLICHVQPLTGLENLPAGAHYVLAPYVSGKEEGAPRNPNDPNSSFRNDPIEPEGGGDIKWIPNPDTAVDATINPDFSQVESDVAQLAVNQRFALLFPEKRPFFLEGVDLFDTPIRAVYTRTITSPSWGARGTGKIDSSTYTVLVSEDRGGGSVILPGPQSSTFAPQDFHSFVGIGRLRHDFGDSFGGLLLTDREISGGGYNRVLGPDFQWSPTGSDRVTGQFLYSESREPDRTDLTPEWNGQHLSGHALDLGWQHTTRTFVALAQYLDFSDGFRADDGFVPQVGFREGNVEVRRPFYPEGGLFSFLQPRVGVDDVEDREGGLLHRRIYPGMDIQGVHNLIGFVGANIDTERVGEPLLHASYAVFQLQIDPSPRFTRIGVTGSIGQQIDFDNAREGSGGDLAILGTARPTDHLQLDVNADWRWLNVRTAEGLEGRLFTALVARLKATYVFNARATMRVIGQYVEVTRDPALYTFPVDRKTGNFDGSVLFSYKVNWQTVAYFGYGDSRALVTADAAPLLKSRYDLAPAGRQFFLKVSYAFQR